MIMSKATLFAGLLMTMFLAACSGDHGRQQLETAQFEEKQNNRDHAIKLYEEVISKYPGTDNAKIAQERLSALKGRK
jgi:outer membrane protein assembly factor BamD (BamD/ComL family)